VNKCFVIIATLMLVTLGLAANAPAQNLLADPDFEIGTELDNFEENWEHYGNCFHEPVTPRSGSRTAKLFGQFTGSANESGIYQYAGAQPGDRFKAGIYLRHNSNDALEGGNHAVLKVEFCDAQYQVLASAASSPLTAESPQDEYQPFEVESEAAPDGTHWVRIHLVFSQADGHAPGAVFADDASLEKLP
jgi:hypothetical protein